MEEKLDHTEDKLYDATKLLDGLKFDREEKERCVYQKTYISVIAVLHKYFSATYCMTSETESLFL